MNATMTNRTRPIWVTSITDRLDHAVTLDAMGAFSAGGTLRLLCGTTLLPASLSSPPGRHCRACAAILGERARAGPRRGRHARHGLWAWVGRTRRW